MMSPLWYLRRLSRMGPREIADRAVTLVRIRRWRAVLDAPAEQAWLPVRRFTAVLPAGACAAIPAGARARLLATADRLMDGYADYFGITRDDMVAPDWSFDPKTGRRAPSDAYAFDIAYRDEQAVGDVKQLWEPSRHQHLTVLAAAYALTGDDRYAHRVADHLKSWWAANPPMRGVHWISGIELGIGCCRGCGCAGCSTVGPARRGCSRTTPTRCTRSATTSASSLRSRAAARRPTIT
jgi:hypothetical protein